MLKVGIRGVKMTIVNYSKSFFQDVYFFPDTPNQCISLHYSTFGLHSAKTGIYKIWAVHDYVNNSSKTFQTAHDALKYLYKLAGIN